MAAQQQKQKKHLPKRSGRPRGKAYRSLCRTRQNKRKEARRQAQAAAEARNKARGYTEWDVARERV